MGKAVANSLLLAGAALRRSLKLLGSGNLARQQATTNTIKRLEIGLQRAIVTAKNDFIRECSAAYRSHKERDFHAQLITHRLAVKMLLQQQAQHVIPTFGQAALRDIRSSVKSRGPIETKKAGDDSLFNRLIQQWLGQRKDMASSIAQTTLNDVLNAVQSGIDDGDGTDEIARGIDDVTRLSLPRSRVIARTETHAAASFAQIESARSAETDLGIKLVKTWLPTLDDRTRPDHADMADYGPIPLDEKFVVGGFEMDRPGDPAGPASEVIACRCVCVFGQAS